MKNCEFCSKKTNSRIIIKNKFAFCIFDRNPVTKFHTLIITKRHIKSFFDLKEKELKFIFSLVKKIKSQITKKDKLIKGYNFGINFGKIAGQTIYHCHFHLIPRRKNDFDLRTKKLKKKLFWIK